jgi:hypothetical protein
MTQLLYLLPRIRVLLLIRSITATTWGHEAWPEVKPVLRRALEMRRQIARELVELDAGAVAACWLLVS